MNTIDEMVRGYMAGLDSGAIELPACHLSEPIAFRHGWLNGRDDRIGQPRELADTLRRRANMILGEKS